MDSTITRYQIKMENFEGPLDLLCHLVEKNKMDICDIKINEITNQYLDYLQMMHEMNLDVTSEFIIMASRLIYLKSKSLLPSLEDEEEEEIDLTQMLIEYKKYKENAILLKKNSEEYGGKVYKAPEKIELPKGKIERQYETYIIPEIYAGFVRRENEKKNANADNLAKLAVNEKVTIKSKIKEILKFLLKAPTFVFNKVFNTKQKSKVEVMTAFLGLLELSRANRIQIRQNTIFVDIYVTKIKRKEYNEMN